MASSALRLRRALSFSSALVRSTSTVHHSPISRFPFASPAPTTTSSNPKIGFRGVHTTTLSLSASRSFNQGNNDQIDENTILFEGCDYKHWLITMDFPKDPPPSPEEMVETYVQTLAKVVGSVEEAKQRMYACSTTTYHGFQAEMDEETSQKFENMPGVVFVLPDSYIDPVNKEYGGDKYINGTIIPRPPPVQYGRQRRPREQQNYGQRQNFPSEQNHGPGQGYPPRDNHGPTQNYPPRDNRGPMQNYPPRDNHGPTQNYPPRDNHGPTQNYPPRDNHGPTPNYPPRGNYGPVQNYPPRDNHGPAQNYPPRDNHGPVQNYPPQQNYAPPQQNYAPPQQNYAPPQQNFNPPRQGQRMDSPPPYNQGSYNQRSDYPSRNQSNQNFAPPSPSGEAQYGQGGHGQGFADHGENRQFNPPHGQQNVTEQKQQSNYPPMGHTGRD